MDSEFQKWYKVVRLCPTENEMNQRLQIVKKYRKIIKQNNILHLVKLSFLIPTDSEFKNKFREKFNSKTNILPNNNDAEAAVLAGAILKNLMTPPLSKKATLSAYMILTSSFKGIGRKPVFNELNLHANNYIKDSALKLFARDSFRKPSEITLDIDEIEESIYGYIENNQLAQIEKKFDGLINQVEKKFAKQRQQIRSLSTALEQQNEETKILLLLLQQSVDNITKKFSDIELLKRIISFTFKLCETIKTYTGWIRGDYYLYKSIMMMKNYNRKKFPIKDVIKTLSSETIEEKIRNSISIDTAFLCPLHYGLISFNKSLDTNGWEKNYINDIGVSLNNKLSLGNLARQCYQERIILNELTGEIQ